MRQRVREGGDGVRGVGDGRVGGGGPEREEGSQGNGLLPSPCPPPFRLFRFGRGGGMYVSSPIFCILMKYLTQQRQQGRGQSAREGAGQDGWGLGRRGRWRRMGRGLTSARGS